MLPNKEMTFGGNYMGKCQHIIPNGVEQKDCPVCRSMKKEKENSMLPDEKIIEIIQKHYPCFDAQDDAELLALEREIEAEAVKAERELWYYAVKRWMESGSNQTLDELIDQLRMGKP